MVVQDVVFSGALTGGFDRWLVALALGQSTPTGGKLGDAECVNALHVAHLRIDTYALKYRMMGSNPQPCPFILDPYRNYKMVRRPGFLTRWGVR